ncbi:ABC transporter permease [Aureimonas frigidaquae]|uniref:Permease component of ABC-type sugar transporter n=1 Tax=Aureimonas frigidaquae TaxID=424757 RepID=A0A0P0Z485_9HYPH|nr:ABC transporter permease subunit [Aureimonas frigidaquae]BAT28814.1 permease component of ABC-type sugar transporter [Aureimonas frigidaquae]
MTIPMQSVSASVAPKGRRRKKRSVPAFAYLAVAPTLILMVLIVGLPLLYSLYLSFNSTNPITKRWVFVGLANYQKVFNDAAFWASLGRTLYFSSLAVIGTTVLGTLMALVLNQPFFGRGVLRSVVLVPWAMAPVSVGVLWSFVYAGNFGLLNGLLHDLGLGSLARPWFGDGFRALNLVTLTQVWNQAPLTTLMLLSALQSMPANLHRAALLDGAGSVRRFFAITLPWLKPTLVFSMVIATINALMTFDIILIMTRGGPGAATTTLSWHGYMQSFQFLKFGEGAAILYVLTFLSLAFAILYFVVLRPRRVTAARNDADTPTVERVVGGARPRMETLPTPRRRTVLAPAAARHLGSAGFRLAVGAIFVWSLLPVLALLLISLSPATDLIRTPPSVWPSSLTLDNYRAVLLPDGGTTSVQAARVPVSILNSLLIGVSVALINVALGTLAGYAFARHASKRFFAVSLWALLLTRMVPALTLVLPFFVLFRTLGLIDTHLGLIIAYSTILMPLAAWMMKSTFENVPESLERAALIDGCSRFAMFRKILVPVVRPGIIAALIFSFLVSWNEFLFAMILTSTPRTQTIPVVIAGFLNQARFYEYGPLFAASVLAILPPVTVAFFFQRFLVQGALSGAVKG